MISETLRKLYENYYASPDFKKWRNELVCEIYSSLNKNISYNEVQIVTALCDVLSGNIYRGLRIDSKKTHSRSTSGVEFDYIDKRVVTELADMVIISVLTANKRIQLLRTAYIQNKKATYHKSASDSWKIDQKQLFLLKNFPSFTGVSGLFNGKTENFINEYDKLGNYGLFTSNGDMVLLTARNTFCNQNANGSINYDSIRNAATSVAPQNHYCRLPFCDRCSFEYLSRKNRYLPVQLFDSLRYFNGYSYALDVHEIVRELTFLNIGEPVCAFGMIIDESNYFSTVDLLRSAFGCSIDGDYFYFGNSQQVIIWDGGVNVILNHLELDENID
jgi:hypothetical protein